MRTKIFFFIVALGMTVVSFAQNGFNYKFVLTDDAGTPLMNTSVNVKFTIKDAANAVVWEEEHTGIMTDDNGLAQCNMGEGVKLSGTAATFDDIDWSSPLTYDVAIDDGSGYTDYVVNQPFKYVPVAKFAQKADYNGLENKPEVFYSSGTTEPARTADETIYRTGIMAIGGDYTSNNVKLYVYNDETGSQAGQKIEIQSDASDTGNKNGLSNIISGDGSGYMTNLYNEITTTGNGTNINVRNRLTGTGTGSHVGVFNYLGGGGDGYQAGEYTQITNSGNGYNIGNYMDLRGSGNGLHIGYYAGLSGSGSGDKYGAYIYIAPSAGGAHYGVYSMVDEDNAYAGFFIGNVYVSKKLLGLNSGQADMKPYIYGSVLADGTVEPEGSSDGFTVTYNAPGDYTIQFDNAPGSANYYIVNATLQDNASYGLITVHRSADNFQINIVDINGTPMDMNFSFVVYKK